MLVLIIDSSIQIIERLEEIISEGENISTIDTAISYEGAKKIFNEKKHHVLLLDIDLPGNDSLKLLREIKKINEETCIIILFNHIDNYTQKQYKSLGADFFFDKFYDFEKINLLLAEYSHKYKE